MNNTGSDNPDGHNMSIIDKERIAADHERILIGENSSNQNMNIIVKQLKDGNRVTLREYLTAIFGMVETQERQPIDKKDMTSIPEDLVSIKNRINIINTFAQNNRINLNSIYLTLHERDDGGYAMNIDGAPNGLTDPYEDNLFPFLGSIKTYVQDRVVQETSGGKKKRKSKKKTTKKKKKQTKRKKSLKKRRRKTKRRTRK